MKLINLICLFLSVYFFITGFTHIASGSHAFRYDQIERGLIALGDILIGGIFFLVGSLGLLLQVYLYNKDIKS